MIASLRKLMCRLVGHNWRVRMSGNFCQTCKVFRPYPDGDLS